MKNENKQIKTNGLKGALQLYNPICLSVIDAFDGFKSFKLSEVEVISPVVDQWGKDYVNYVNPNTGKAAFSLVLFGLMENMVLLSQD